MSISKKFLEQSQGKILIKTKDSLLVRDYLDQIKEMLPDHQMVLCDNIESFSEAANSGTLFGPSKRIIVLTSLKKEELDGIVELFDRPLDDTLVFVEDTPLLKTKAYTRIKSVCGYVELKPPTESERAVWVKKWLVEAGLTFGEEIPSYLVSLSGADLSRLHNEVKKLKYLLSDSSSRVVTKGMCDQLVASNSESQFFVFMENFFKKRLPEVLSEFKKVDEYSYVKLLHFMIGQVDRLYKIAIYKEQGHKAEHIAEIVGIPAFIVKTKMFTALSFYGKMKLVILLDLLNKLDLELRSTKYSKALVFEVYLIKAFKI